jgi:hypothetical protein
MSQQQSATDQINGLLDQLSIEVTAAIGRIAAAWVYLETEFDLALECLLVHRNTEGLQDDYILIPFKSRLAVLRAAGKLVYPQPVFSEFEQVLSKVANAYGKRNPVIHGRFTGIGGGSCSVETHRHTSKGGGPFRVTTRTYSIKQLAAISSEVVDAAGTFVAFNRKHLPGRPASVLDLRRDTFGKYGISGSIPDQFKNGKRRAANRTAEQQQLANPAVGSDKPGAKGR